MMASSQDSQPFHWHFTELEDRDFQIRGRTVFFIIVLFAFVLVVALLFVYGRWICLFRHGSPSSTFHAPHSPPMQPRGLDPATIRALPVSLFTNGRAEENECSICLSLFEDGDKVKALPRCQHLYHSECVDRWLSAESNCPLCRASLQSESGLPRIITQ